MRKLMWITIGIMASCAFCAYFMPAWVLYACAGFAVLTIGLAFGSRIVEPLRFGAMVCLGICIGCLLFSVFDTYTLSEVRKLDGKTEYTTLIVRDYSYETEYGCAADATIERNGHHYALRVYLDDDRQLEPGNRLIGDFRYEMTLREGKEELTHHSGKGIFLIAYQEGPCVVERFWSVPLRDLPAVWRSKIEDIIDRVFPEDTCAFAKALLLGLRYDLDYKTNTDFKVSGISHVIAVSGLHVSILFGLIQLLAAKKRFLTALMGIPVVILFAAVAGFTPSITRAAIVQVLVMLAALLDKEYDAPTALSFAALLMVLGNPLVITSVSFQLSFACMMGIQLFSSPIHRWLTEKLQPGNQKRKWLSGLSSGISVTVGAMVLTSPFVAIHFGVVSLIGVVTNLLILWVITFVFYGIMLVCVAAWIHIGAGVLLAEFVSWPIRYVLAVSGFLADLPLAAVYTKSGYIVAWLVFVYVLLVTFSLLRKRPVAVFLAAVAISLCVAVGISWVAPLVEPCRMTMLDVGQGQAILLQSHGKNFLVDCGGDYEEDAADTVAETLLSQGINYLDGIILTHFDKDHSGGVEYLLTRIDAGLILMPHAVDDKGVAGRISEVMGDKAVRVTDDMDVCYDDTVIRIFAPESYNSGNESSLCVLFQAGNCDILITGDRGMDGERMLLKFHELPQVDVLVVGHHGSKHSTSKELLAAVRPSYAFISVGEENFYGHPASEVLERLEEYGCVVYRTDEDGTIIYRG